jgi:hypothetical protein
MEADIESTDVEISAGKSVLLASSSRAFSSILVVRVASSVVAGRPRTFASLPLTQKRLQMILFVASARAGMVAEEAEEAKEGFVECAAGWFM